MIYTCTLNPSIDYTVWLDHFTEGDINRTTKEYFTPGGKGVNVSLLLNNLKIESTLLGFVGGFTGEAFLNELKRYPYCKLDFVRVEENTRLNVTILAKQESKINANGPTTTEDKIEELISKVEKISENDVFVLSGSIPPSIKRDLYGEIARIVKNRNGILVVDTTKDRLVNLLKYKPFLIKPNKSELEEIFNVTVNTDDEIIHHARKLQDLGAQNVLVSLGKDGSILLTENDLIFRANTKKGLVKNTVGAGDSMIAGFVSCYLKTKSYTEALRFGASCGASSAFSIGVGEEDLIHTLYETIEVKEITK